MSTKIYNGFKLRDGSLRAIYERLHFLRPDVITMQLKLQSSHLARTATSIADCRALGLLEYGTGSQEYDDRSRSPISMALDEMRLRQKAIKAEGRRDPEVDFDLSISLLPGAGVMYALLYTEQTLLRDWFSSHPWVEDYSWWDNADHPEDVTQTAWDARERAWKSILGKRFQRRPSDCGLSLDFAPINHLLELDAVVKQAPSIHDRAPALAERIVLAQMPYNKSDNPIAHFNKVRDWMTSDPEGRSALQEAMDHVVETIEEVSEELLTRLPCCVSTQDDVLTL